TDSNIVDETFRLGAHGFVDKSLALSDLLPAIQAVLQGTRFISAGVEFKNVAHNRHDVQFYSEDSLFLKSATRFLSDAITAADATIVLATKSHRNQLRRKLQRSGIDVDGAIRGGTLIALDADETLSSITVNGAPSPNKFTSSLSSLVESVAQQR